FSVQLANNGSREGRYLLQVQDIQQLIAPDALNTTLGAGERTGISFTIQVPVTKESGVYSGGIAVMVENTTASIPVTVIIGSRQPRQLVVDLGITGNRLPVVEATVYNVGRQVRVDTRLSVTVDNANGSQVRHWQQNLTVGTAREIRKRLEALQPGEYTVRAAIAYDDRRSTAMQTIRIEGDRGRERDRLPALPFNPVPALKIVVLLALAGILALVTERVYHQVSHLELPGSAEEDVTRPATPREEREKIRVREAITCEDCGREFVSEENYRIHRNTHHG
ncbi:MAG: hypothetical protein SVU32_07285, partial [Candidatus Nanohaloarchaea archaeon]|nr:hypothetical protein [Candidatus Nanohaloarchaea archaeon]